MHRSLLMTATIATAALIPAGAAPAATPVTVLDLLNIQEVTSVDLDDSGAFAVYTLKSIVRVGDDKAGLEKYDSRSHLWMVRLDDPAAVPHQLTFGDREDSDPAISPDGAYVAFVRQAAPDDGDHDGRDARPGNNVEKPKPQVWLLPIASPGEAEQVTTLEQGARAPVWRPDSAALLVTSPIPFSKIDGTPDFDSERPARDWGDAVVQASLPAVTGTDSPKVDARPDGDVQSVRNWLERNAHANNPNVFNRLAFQDEHSLKGEESFSHLFLIEPAKDCPRDPSRLAEPCHHTQLTKGYRNHSDAAFSPDGRSIVFVDKPRTREHPDRMRRTSIFMMRADGSAIRPILDDPSWSYSSPRFTRNGKELVFTATRQDEWMLYQQSRLGRIAVSGGEPTWLAADWPTSVSDPVVSETGVYFEASWQGGFPLFFQPFETNAREARPITKASSGSRMAIVEGPIGAGAFDAAGGVVAAAITNVDNPSELFAVDRPGAAPRKLTHHNDAWLKDRIISTPTEHWISRPDGERIQYWVMEPTNRRPGVKYPTVLEIHGGPMAMWGPGEFTMWHEFQLLTSWGYGVVYANPRGSSGYGFDFQRGNHQNWGVGPTGDVLAALDDAIENNAWIDADRQFVIGGSYAGYLTAWIVGHTDRFKAAVAQRGVYDLETFFGEGNAWLLVEHAMGGFPWQPEIQKVLDRESPFTYVNAINTPLLIMHSSSDLRTGVAQSEMMYRALKELKKPVEYVRYPGAGHDLSRTGDARQRLDRLMRIVEFFERYSNNDRVQSAASAP